eukprot:g419.t1
MNDSFFHPNPYVLRLGRDRKNPSEEDTSVIQAACYKWTAEIGATGLEGEEIQIPEPAQGEEHSELILCRAPHLDAKDWIVATPPPNFEVGAKKFTAGCWIAEAKQMLGWCKSRMDHIGTPEGVPETGAPEEEIEDWSQGPARIKALMDCFEEDIKIIYLKDVCHVDDEEAVKDALRSKYDLYYECYALVAGRSQWLVGPLLPFVLLLVALLVATNLPSTIIKCEVKETGNEAHHAPSEAKLIDCKRPIAAKTEIPQLGDFTRPAFTVNYWLASTGPLWPYFVLLMQVCDDDLTIPERWEWQRFPSKGSSSLALVLLDLHVQQRTCMLAQLQISLALGKNTLLYWIAWAMVLLGLFEAFITAWFYHTVFASWTGCLSGLAFQGGHGLHIALREKAAKRRVMGILNGISDEWNPLTDPHIVMRFGKDNFEEGKRCCKAGLQRQLGLSEDLGVRDCLSWLMRDEGNGVNGFVQLAMMGKGDLKYESQLRKAEESFPGRVCAFVGFDPIIEHRMMAGCDILLMPSQYEPCGLPQMYAQQYATLPVVHETGGLKDSVRGLWNEQEKEHATGFLFGGFDTNRLKERLYQAMDIFRHKKAVWRQMQANAIQSNYYWPQAIDEYEKNIDQESQKGKRGKATAAKVKVKPATPQAEEALEAKQSAEKKSKESQKGKRGKATAAKVKVKPATPQAEEALEAKQSAEKKSKVLKQLLGMGLAAPSPEPPELPVPTVPATVQMPPLPTVPTVPKESKASTVEAIAAATEAALLAGELLRKARSREGLRLLFQFKGSVFPKAFLFALPSVVLAALLLFLSDNAEEFKEINIAADLSKGQVWTALTGSLGLLIGFRTSQSLNRFWAARPKSGVLCHSPNDVRSIHKGMSTE